MPTLFQQIQNYAQHHPHQIALWHYNNTTGTPTSTTFKTLAENAQQFAHAFHTHAPETTILPLYLAKSPHCIAAMIGALGANKAFSVLNKKLKMPQVNSILHDTAAQLGLIDGPGVMNLRNGFEANSPLTHTRWWLLRDDNFLSLYEKAIQQLRHLSHVDNWPLNDPNHHTTADDTIPLNPDPQQPGCCLFTSGSTGTPKGVLIAAHDLQARAQAEIEWFELTADDILLSVLPFSFDVGLNQLLSALTVGCTLVLLDSWLPADILKAVSTFRVTGISAVPSIWTDMINANLSFNTAIEHASLRYITISGGDLNPKHLEQLPHLAPGVGIFKTYGQTEAFRATSLRPHEFKTKSRSVGRPFTGVHLYIVRKDSTVCAANETGEIVHTGLGTMLGYLGEQDAYPKRRPNPFRGEHDHSPHAIFTGDLGYLDEDGYLFLQGRQDAMLKVAGNRIYPKEIVSQILTLEQIQEAEVVGVKATTGDTHLVAFVVTTPTATLTPQQLRGQLTARLPSYMVPREIVIVTAIPRTASGKPDYPALTQDARQRLAATP